MSHLMSTLHDYRRHLSVFVLIVIVAWPLESMLRFGGTAMEEGLILTGAELVLDGRTPNGGFEHLYGPASLWVPAGAFAIFGVSITVERLVGLGYRLVLLWGIHRLARRWGWGVATATTALAWAIIAPFGLIAYSWIAAIAFGTASLAVALDADHRPRRWLAAGALAGLALLFRADLLIALALGLGPVVYAASNEGRRRFLSGLGVGGVGYLIHIATAGPIDVIRGMFVDPVIRLRPGRRLPVPPSWNDAGDFFARLDSGADDLWGLDRSAQIAALFWVVVVVALLTVVVAKRSGDKRLLAISLFAAGTLPQLLQRPSPNHLKFVGVLVFSAAAIALGRRLQLRLFSGVAAVVVFAALVAVAPHHIGRFTHQVFFEAAPDVSVSHSGRTLPVGDPSAAADIEAILAALDAVATPGDRVFVGPEVLARTNYSDTFLYHLLPDYEPGSYHLEMNPGLANRDGGRLADDVASSDWLLLNSLFDGWSEPNASVDDGDPRADAVVEQQFCALTTVSTRTLYGRCDR